MCSVFITETVTSVCQKAESANKSKQDKVRFVAAQQMSARSLYEMSVTPSSLYFHSDTFLPETESALHKLSFYVAQAEISWGLTSQECTYVGSE